MEPTLKRPYTGARSEEMRTRLTRLLGRESHEGDYIMMECMWAGQLGHEKCGWCAHCHRPRWLECKDCKHPFEKVWKNDT